MITRGKWRARRILHAGEGPPDREIDCYPPQACAIEEAAQFFADQMDEAEKRDRGLCDSDFDHVPGMFPHVIEIQDLPGTWRRFEVICRVVRNYEAREIK